MQILVAIKQVPARDSRLQIAPAGEWIEEDDLAYEINEPDAYALEAALQLKEKHGGEVIALCAGPERVAPLLREALAKGVDRAIHVAEDHPEAWDTLAWARLLAVAAETEKPDLVLTGLQSDDLGWAQTGVVMAELMRLPHATLVMQIEIEDGKVRVKRELEGGWFQRVSLPLPALVTIQSGISRLRYATLMGIKKARSKPLRRLTAAELGVAPARAVRLRRLYLPRRARETEMLAGSAQEQAAQLVEKLRHEARVL
jgi:electron transfer flavoprotein beta subunit